jgi:hypothetical protein
MGAPPWLGHHMVRRAGLAANDGHQQARTRLIHMAQPLTCGDPEDNARGRQGGRRRKRNGERPGIGGGGTDESGSHRAQEGRSYLATKAWGGEETALARERSGGHLRRAWRWDRGAQQERVKASPTCQRWVGAGYART